MTKTAIRRETQISAPTIRRIIRESEKSHATERYLHPLRSGDTLLLNMTRHWPPTRSRNTHERLMNGCALWRLPDVLPEIYPPNIVDIIIDEVKKNNGAGKIMEVSIYLDDRDIVVVEAFGLFPK